MLRPAKQPQSSRRRRGFFSIELHGKDAALLQRMFSYFKVGFLRVSKKEDGSTRVVYCVRSLS